LSDIKYTLFLKQKYDFNLTYVCIEIGKRLLSYPSLEKSMK
jgi:hypothetical protein